MKTRNLIVLSAFVGLSSACFLGAAQKDEGVEVLTSYRQVLEGKTTVTEDGLPILE